MSYGTVNCESRAASGIAPVFCKHLICVCEDGLRFPPEPRVKRSIETDRISQLEWRIRRTGAGAPAGRSSAPGALWSQSKRAQRRWPSIQGAVKNGREQRRRSGAGTEAADAIVSSGEASAVNLCLRHGCRRFARMGRLDRGGNQQQKTGEEGDRPLASRVVFRSCHLLSSAPLHRILCSTAVLYTVF